MKMVAVVHCSNIQMVSSTELQCRYDGDGTPGNCDKHFVKVFVDGQMSNSMYICYPSADRGSLVRGSSNIQRVSENSTVAYSISLTLKKPSEDVDVYLQASVVNNPTHSTMTCTVYMPSQIKFKNKTSVAVAVRVGGNQVDEGANTVAFQCRVKHTVYSSDSQYTNIPARYMSIDIMNDDVADARAVDI